jgi:hypothetical protein
MLPSDAFTLRRSQIVLASSRKQRPKVIAQNRGCATLSLAAEVCFEQGLTENLMSIEAIRQALLRLGVGWQRAKHWITSPDPDYVKKKTTAAILAEAVCAQDLQDKLQDHDESEPEHVVRVDACLIHLARHTTAQYRLVGGQLHKNNAIG